MTQLLLPDTRIFTLADDTPGVVVESGHVYIVKLVGQKSPVRLSRHEFLVIEDRADVASQQARIEIYRRAAALDAAFPDTSGLEFGSDKEAKQIKRARLNFLLSVKTIFKPQDIGDLAPYLMDQHQHGAVRIKFSFPDAILEEVTTGLADMGVKTLAGHFRPIVYGARKENAERRWAPSGLITFPKPADVGIIPDEFRARRGKFNGSFTEETPGTIELANWRLAVGVAKMLDVPLRTHDGTEDRQTSIYDLED
ncbi:Uncharacterised protein [uncultured archaeon]|nr:Uncharacterised protein [uncultured archaeon]